MTIIRKGEKNMLSEILAAKITATITAAEATAYGMVLADLQNP